MNTPVNTPSPLALTMGDPSGIGPDITIEAWSARQEHDLPPFVLFADPKIIRARAALMGMTVPVHEVSDPSEAVAIFPDALPVAPIETGADATPGQPNPENASAVIGAIDAAVTAVHKRLAGAVVTNPIAKSVLYDAGFTHPGHTEYLATLAARLWGGPAPRPVMLLASDELRVAPATIHIPLSKVPEALSNELVEETARIMLAALTMDYGIENPRLALTGLNPHAGEAGALGTEDAVTIAPVVEQLTSEGHLVTGPHPADTIFHEQARTTYDAVLAMYHDQALIPIKTLAFDRGVNVTLGLPFVRTSPDHGTAFAIAGSGKAAPTSLIEALKEASKLVANRAVFQQETLPA